MANTQILKRDIKMRRSVVAVSLISLVMFTALIVVDVVKIMDESPESFNKFICVPCACMLGNTTTENNSAKNIDDKRQAEADLGKIRASQFRKDNLHNQHSAISEMMESRRRNDEANKKRQHLNGPKHSSKNPSTTWTTTPIPSHG